MNAIDVDYEKKGSKVHVRKLQSGQQRYHMALSRMQNEIVVLLVELVQDRKYLFCRLKHGNNQIVSSLVQKLTKWGTMPK